MQGTPLKRCIGSSLQTLGHVNGAFSPRLLIDATSRKLHTNTTLFPQVSTNILSSEKCKTDFFAWSSMRCKSRTIFKNRRSARGFSSEGEVISSSATASEVNASASHEQRQRPSPTYSRFFGSPIPPGLSSSLGAKQLTEEDMQALIKEETKVREKEKESANPIFETKTKENGETYIEVRVPGSEIVQRWEPIPEKAPFKDQDFLALGEHWNGEMDLSGWWLSEKYDGTRAYWDGTTLYTRMGEKFKAPQSFIDQLPVGVTLDGELWGGYCSQHLTNRYVHSGQWNKLEFLIFDSPAHKGTFEERMEFLKQHVPPNLPQVKLVEYSKVKDNQHLLKTLDSLVQKGVEGLIIRQPGSVYTVGRGITMLKVKPIQGECCVVADSEKIEVDSKGMEKRKHMLVRNKLGKSYHLRFKVSQRMFPFVTMNATIAVRYSGFSPSGSPRFPIIKDHHQLVKWEHCYTYWLQTKNRFDTWDHCSGCQKEFKDGDVRVQTKGMTWLKKEADHEPIFALFSFCPSKECIDLGYQKAKERRQEYPQFSNQIAIREEVLTPMTDEQRLVMDNLRQIGMEVIEEHSEMTVDDDVFHFNGPKKDEKMGKGRKRKLLIP